MKINVVQWRKVPCTAEYTIKHLGAVSLGMKLLAKEPQCRVLDADAAAKLLEVDKCNSGIYEYELTGTPHCAFDPFLIDNENKVSRRVREEIERIQDRIDSKK